MFQGPPLLLLPSELLDKILSHLDYRSLIDVQLVAQYSLEFETITSLTAPRLAGL
ncbi:hypothetical protein P691DRAFT_811605 [Macrolepiota fuliginosa MF-IS2]|uniref:F-box domain-containing protein n=1 Tax=Macrolepiota fuliginosa MF-IS2 TaxID=1400762 RepID=A0A9P5X225_9AGAR|nr:hypothetical protein P691DRAFT_811605 [Macrolepiota fuliginosa MF-IS2]